MDIISKIIFLLKEKNMDQKQLCNALGIPVSVFSDWKSGRNKSYTKRLPEIAEQLNVSIDYLLGKTEIRNSNIVNGDYNVVGNANSNVSIGNEQLTDQETELLNIFKSLSVMNKAKALIYLSELKDK